jgi:hypothetical protein
MTSQNRTSPIRLEDTDGIVSAREDDSRGRHVCDENGTRVPLLAGPVRR